MSYRCQEGRRKANPPTALEERVRRDLDFLFADHRARVVSRTAQPFGISEVTVATRNLELKFESNPRDADYRVLLGPHNTSGVWELLHVALAAATGEQPKSLMAPFSYTDEPSDLAYVGLTRVAEILKPRLAQLELAFAPENYAKTHSRAVEIERSVHPK
jgi:hypothetical protein